MLRSILNRHESQCAKCGGSMSHGKDWAGEYLTCIMCGQNVDLELRREVRRPNSLARMEHFRAARESAIEIKNSMTQRPIANPA